jgi:hypothetical protein
MVGSETPPLLDFRWEVLPELPPSGLETTALAAKTKGGFVVDVSNFPRDTNQLAVGPEAKLLAYTRTTAHRNLFRIALH